MVLLVGRGGIQPVKEDEPLRESPRQKHSGKGCGEDVL